MEARILVVDDEAPVRESLALILGRSGYLIETASSGEEALSMCQTSRFDLILTDMRMPGIDGQQLLARLREMKCEQRVILLTAFPPADVSLFDAVVLKPFSIEDLRTRVSAVLRTCARGSDASRG